MTLLPACVGAMLSAVSVGAGLTSGLPGDGPPLPYPHPLITEILYAVPTGAAGDANKDGSRDAAGDEFIELVNPHDRPIQLGGYTLADRGANGRPTLQFTFPACDLGPGQAAVVFNGHDQQWTGPVGDAGRAPAGGNEAFHGAMVFTMNARNSRTGLSNKGDMVVLTSPGGQALHAVSWGEAPAAPADVLFKEAAPAVSAESVERRSVGGPLERAVGGGASKFSPGVIPFSVIGAESSPPGREGKKNGAGDAPPDRPAPRAPAGAKEHGRTRPPPLVPYPLPLITEVLLDVPPDGDANGDGIADPAGDQFIELLNPHDRPIELGGLTISDRAALGVEPPLSQLIFTFPKFQLPAGGVVLIFNGHNARWSGPVGTREKAPEAAYAPLHDAYVFSMQGQGPVKTLPRDAGWLVVRPAGSVASGECVFWGPRPDAPPRNLGLVEGCESADRASIARTAASREITPHRRIDGTAMSPGWIAARAEAAAPNGSGPHGDPGERPPTGSRPQPGHDNRPPRTLAPTAPKSPR